MIAYDLFCGAGGASTGLATLDLTVIGFDAWDTACASHEANGHRTVHADLDHIEWGPVVAEHGRPDIVWASPPCQPFSAAGLGEGEDDDRDGMPAFLRAVHELRPRIVAMENVKGLTFDKHLPYLHRALGHLRADGYRVDWQVLNAADYGVPQTRERLIVIARNDDGPLVWPTPTHTEEPGLFTAGWVSMADALGWGMTARPYPTVASARKSGGPDKEKVGGSGDDAQQIPVTDPAPAVGGVGSQWQWRRPATTIAGDPRVWPPGHKINADDIAHGRTGHDRAGSEAIRVTVEEAATLQGFPPGYVFRGSRTAQFQQIGNAAPPALASAVVGALL